MSAELASLREENGLQQASLKENGEQIEYLNAKVMDLNMKLAQTQTELAKANQQLQAKPQARQVRDMSTCIHPAAPSKKAAPVKKHELLDIRLRLTLHLIKEGMCPLALERLLGERLAEAPVQEEVRELLLGAPFSLPWEEACRLALYLAEDNPPLPVVKSIFRVFLGAYPLFSCLDRQLLRQQLTACLARWRTSIFYSEEIDPEDIHDKTEVMGLAADPRLETFMLLEQYSKHGCFRPIKLSLLA